MNEKLSHPDAAHALRSLLKIHHASAPAENHPPSPASFWITYLVGRGEELDEGPGHGTSFGFLAVRAAGPLEAEAEAERLLAQRSASLGCGYTVTAVHSAATLTFALFGLHAVENGLVAPPCDGDVETWEENLSAQLPIFLRGDDAEKLDGGPREQR